MTPSTSSSTRPAATAIAPRRSRGWRYSRRRARCTSCLEGSICAEDAESGLSCWSPEPGSVTYAPLVVSSCACHLAACLSRSETWAGNLRSWIVASHPVDSRHRRAQVNPAARRGHPAPPLDASAQQRSDEGLDVKLALGIPLAQHLLVELAHTGLGTVSYTHLRA